MGSCGILRAGFVGTLLLCAVVGCDDRPAVPVELNEQQPQKTEDVAPLRPTTQELVSGTYAPLLLDTFPLTITAPTGWKVVRLGAIVLVEGYTPVDQARIQLSHREPATPVQLDTLYNGAKRDIDDDPNARLTVELREIGPLKVLERRSIGRTLNIPITDAQGIQKLDDKGQPLAQRSTKMNWKLNIFVPSASGFEQYEMNFIDLSVEQYEADKAFLEKIVYSLALVGAAPVVPSTAPAK